MTDELDHALWSVTRFIQIIHSIRDTAPPKFKNNVNNSRVTNFQKQALTSKLAKLCFSETL